MFEEQLGETGGTIAQFGLSLIVVVALIFLVAWVVRRFGGARFGAHHGEEAELQVVDTLSIDPKRKLVLVRHGKLEHLLLIGGNSDEVIERSMVGGIPLAARMQASKAQEKQEEETYARPADRFRTSNRFSSALLRSKAGEENRESPTPPPSSPSAATSAAGVAAAGVAAATVAAASKAKAPPAPAVPESAPTKPVSAPASAATAPPVASPVVQDERDALDRSLDEALSASLLDEPVAAPPAPPEAPKAANKPAEQAAKPDPLKLDSLKTEPTAAPSPPAAAKAQPAAPAPSQAPSAAIDDLDLERELEAALELDGFEAPREGGDAPAAVDLPPLPDMPDLPDLSALTGNGDEENAAPASTAKEAPSRPNKPESGAETAPVVTPEVKAEEPKTEPADPLKLSSVRDAKVADETGKPTNPSEGTAETTPEPTPAPNIPVALSGRDDPPIPVAIPSRGPAANATTLAKADQLEDGAEDSAVDDAVDISSMLQPAPAPTEGPSGKDDADTSSDDLDDEMRRLLGEIAGEPESK
ncbi:MAG: flagellar biosynthetic protein FliO [Pseudomonadota bacterium]